MKPFSPPMRALSAALVLLALPACAGLRARPPSLEVSRLRCEFREDALGVDTPRPRLGWIVTGPGRNRKPTAFRVLVAADPVRLARDEADCWDSGKVASPRNHAAYGGTALCPRTRYWWKVRVWDEEDRPSPWSPMAWWETGLMNEARSLSWIGDGRPPPAREANFYDDDPAPLFRKAFELPVEPVRARLYVSGLGYYEARVNGTRAGRRVLDPGWTAYDTRVFYSVYDVLDLLRAGPNCLGVILGNGWYNPLPMRMWGWLNLREHLAVGRPCFTARLEVTCADGSRHVLETDSTWKTAPGPIRRNNIYLGEVYDARYEQPGWDRPGFDDRAWAPAVEVRGPKGALQAQPHPPVEVRDRVAVRSVTEPRPGVYVFDLGENFAGWVRLHVQGPRGTRVRLRYGELLHPDGTLNVLTSTCGQIKPGRRPPPPGVPVPACQEDTYILKGGPGEETWTPRFTFHGFRYVEVTGFPGKAGTDALEGLRLSAAVEEAGTFACSKPLFNRIHAMVRRTFLSNLFHVQSDCPHRERFGYGGDAVPTSEAFIHNFDMAAFYEKVIRDFADAARPCGGLTETAPYVGIQGGGLGGGTGPIGWGFAHPFLQLQLFRYYGDRRIVEEQYETTRRLVEFLRSKAKDGVIERGIGDHESLDPKPMALTGTAFYYAHAALLARFARILHREAEARRYAALAREIEATFVKRFLLPGTGRFGPGTQAAQAFALYYDLVPPAERKAAEARLLEAVYRDHDGHLATGIFGTFMLLHTLSRAGRADTAYTVVSRETFPGWGYMWANGATTLWEHWALSEDTYSHNHPMFGSVDTWFYQWLAGIQPDPGAEGFDRILLRPRPVGDLTWVRGRYESIRGTVVSAWRIEGGRFRWDVHVPVGARAVAYVPAKNPGGVLEGGLPAAQAEGVRFLRQEGDCALFEIGSGRYAFEAPVEDALEASR